MCVKDTCYFRLYSSFHSYIVTPYPWWLRFSIWIPRLSVAYLIQMVHFERLKFTCFPIAIVDIRPGMGGHNLLASVLWDTCLLLVREACGEGCTLHKGTKIMWAWKQQQQKNPSWIAKRIYVNLRWALSWVGSLPKSSLISQSGTTGLPDERYNEHFSPVLLFGMRPSILTFSLRKMVNLIWISVHF